MCSTVFSVLFVVKFRENQIKTVGFDDTQRSRHHSNLVTFQRIRGFTSMRYINRLFTYLLTTLAF